MGLRHFQKGNPKGNFGNPRGNRGNPLYFVSFTVMVTISILSTVPNNLSIILDIVIFSPVRK
jgi:hypothetical protein